MSKMDKCASKAVRWYIGSSSQINAHKHTEAAAHIVAETGATPVLARRAATIAAQKLGLYPAPGYTLPYTIPYHKDLRVGDFVYGGRIVYDEYIAVSGTIYNIDRFNTNDGPMTLVQIADWQGVRDSIHDRGIYRVDWKEPWKNKPATDEQLVRLERIKREKDTHDLLFVHEILSRGEASLLIAEWEGK